MRATGAGADGPTSVTVDSQGRFAYVSNTIAATVERGVENTGRGINGEDRDITPAGINPVALTWTLRAALPRSRTLAQTSSRSSSSIRSPEL